MPIRHPGRLELRYEDMKRKNGAGIVVSFLPICVDSDSKQGVAYNRKLDWNKWIITNANAERWPLRSTSRCEVQLGIEQ
jgi:hypothetical protein